MIKMQQQSIQPITNVLKDSEVHVIETAVRQLAGFAGMHVRNKSQAMHCSFPSYLCLLSTM